MNFAALSPNLQRRNYLSGRDSTSLHIVVLKILHSKSATYRASSSAEKSLKNVEIRGPHPKHEGSRNGLFKRAISNSPSFGALQKRSLSARLDSGLVEFDFLH